MCSTGGALNHSAIRSYSRPAQQDLEPHEGSENHFKHAVYLCNGRLERTAVLRGATVPPACRTWALPFKPVASGHGLCPAIGTVCMCAMALAPRCPSAAGSQDGQR